MPVNVMAILRKAVRELEAERARIDRQLAGLQSVLGDPDSTRGRVARVAPRGHAPRRRRGTSAAARRAISKRMKAYWAKRKAAAAARRT